LIRYVYEKEKIHINTVKAGSISNGHTNCSERNQDFISPLEVFYYNGKKINPKDYIIAKVDGDCMSPRGINGGDIIFIHKFKDSEKNEISKGDILYIKYEKNNHSGYKIREAKEGYTENEEAIKTQYYTSEGKIKVSTSDHNLSNIEGVVKMKFRL
jgi:hypothetical protein